MAKNKVDITLEKKVVLTFLDCVDNIGVFKLNKLMYLFEYFFIKNFGMRYTKEFFVKLPHGPVMPSYKKLIKGLHDDDLLRCDIKQLEINRHLEDEEACGTIQIERSEKTHDASDKTPLIRSMVERIVQKYGDLSCDDLENAVYQTLPVMNYLTQEKNGFKPKTGGYILDGNGIAIRSYNSDKTRINKAVLKHQQKYPSIDRNQQRRDLEELQSFMKLKATFEDK